MSTVGIYYFSGTKNTEYVATLLKKEFKKNATADLIKIEDVLQGKTELEIKKYDIIGMGYPVHALNAPKIFFAFMNNLPVEDKKVFLFKTAGDPFMHGGATSMVQHRLMKKGYHVFYETLVVMPSNVLVQYNERLVKQLLMTAEKKAETIVNDILAGRKKLQKNSIVSQVVTALFSGLEWMGTPFFGKDLTVSKECNLCQECITKCPTQNISRDNDTIVFGSKCIVCLRCVYTCPQKAISPRLYKFFVLKEYNLQKIIDDPYITGDFISKDTKGYYKRFYDYITGD